MERGDGVAFGDYPIDMAYDYRKRKELELGEIKRSLRSKDTACKKSVRTSIGFVDIYLYYPQQDPSKVTRDVVVWNYHGGGFVLRDWELDIPYCQKMADASGALVINVDYVVGPEYKFPAPQMTSYEVLTYCARHADEMRLPSNDFVLCGHSAGGNLAAALCELVGGDDGINVVGMALNYPTLKPMLAVRTCLDGTRSIPQERMEQYATWAFICEDDLSHPLAAPYLAGDVSWPAALINVAEYDSLAPEAEEFARHLRSQGVAVDLKRYAGCMHGFTHSCFNREYDRAASEDAWARIAEFVRRLDEESK